MSERHVTPEDGQRFSLYRLCECPTCDGTGRDAVWNTEAGTHIGRKCPECRGEGRIRQEIASCATPEAVGVAIVTLGREREWEGCAFGLLDREPDCPNCHRVGEVMDWLAGVMVVCHKCKGSGVKATGDWLVLPWLPSARNVRDAARTLARSKKTVRDQ